MAHILTDYFLLKLGTIKRDSRKAVEIIAIKDDFVHFEAHISGNPACHEIHNRLLEVGLVKVKLLKKHKTPLEFYETVFKQFTKQVNKKKFVCIQSYNHTFSSGVVDGYIVNSSHFFKKNDTYCLESLNEDQFLVKCEKTLKIIKVNKDKLKNILKEK